MIEALEWKPCPFCGKKVSLLGIRKEGYEEHQAETGRSVLSVWCSNHECFVAMNYIDENEVPYEEALKALNERWNRRTKE